MPTHFRVLGLDFFSQDKNIHPLGECPVLAHLSTPGLLTTQMSYLQYLKYKHNLVEMIPRNIIDDAVSLAGTSVRKQHHVVVVSIALAFLTNN